MHIHIWHENSFQTDSLESHVRVKSPHLFIQEFVPSLSSPLSFSTSQPILNIWFLQGKKKKTNKTTNLLVAYPMLFMFEFSTHVNFFFISLRCPGLLHDIHFCLHMQSTRSVLKHWYLEYWTKNLNTQIFFYYVFPLS